MNVVLSIESIRPPLTGIGRYTWELATRLPLHKEVSSLRFLSDGMWRGLPNISTPQVETCMSVKASSNANTSISTHSSSPTTSPVQVQLDYKGRIRQRLSQIQFFSQMYSQLKPLLATYQLKSVKDGIFHGTNYFLPQTHLASIVTVHDLSMYRFPQWHPQARIERIKKDIPLAVQRACMVLTDSDATKLEVMQEFNLSSDQVRAIHLGVDETFFPRSAGEIDPILSRFGLKYNGYSLFVSTIEPRKNLINLLAAYSLLPLNVRKSWPLVLVGSKGWQSEEIHQAILQAQKEDWLIYFGFVEQRMLPILYAGCRLFTYPSWYEGFGLPIAEAMASGVPVLTSNCTAMPEVAGGAAVLVEPGDVDSIYNGLRMALEDEKWRAQAVVRGLERASELTWDACVRKTITAYQSIQH